MAERHLAVERLSTQDDTPDRDTVVDLLQVEDGVVVTDEEVKSAIKFLSEHLKIIVEPGGAVAATAALTEKINLKNKTVVVMISGGNIDFEMFTRL